MASPKISSSDMVDDKVTSLFGGPVSVQDEERVPDENIVKFLEQALAKAKAGLVYDISLCYIDRTDHHIPETFRLGKQF